MAYSLNVREKEIENRLRKDYFQGFDAETVLGDIDFAVAVPTDGPQLFEPEYLLWAEAKKSNHNDIYESFVQLILTIGKARTFDKHLPPAFLGAFDAEKIAFIQYNAVLDIFYQNDFNWNVTPSNHETKEFRQIYDTVKGTLDKELLLFHFDNDEKELRGFIKKNFIVGKSKVSKIRINKNNFTAIYQKWLKEVKPTIAKVNWDVAKKQGIIDADFYLADILSEHNVTLREKLYVLLRKDYYELDRRIDDTGFFNSKKAEFTDGQKAHIQFWNKYDRPPRREYWDYIVDRRDLLVPQDVRERKGSFYTPSQWVNLSQQYLAEELGDDWQDEYYIWDCAAGTGNLLAGLTNKYRIWASTLDQADVDVMHDRINRMNEASSDGRNGANLLHDHVFQFDFLNDSFNKLPDSLKDIIFDPEKRKKLVIYINPPYAEGDNRNGEGRRGVAISEIHIKYDDLMGYAKREMFVQFLFRIFYEIPSCIIGVFSTMTLLQGAKFYQARKNIRAQLTKMFLVPANSFDNVRGEFPIAFQIWNCKESPTPFSQIVADIYDYQGNYIDKKIVNAYTNCKYINDWTLTFIEDKKITKDNFSIATIIGIANDFQNQNTVRIENPNKPWNHQYQWQITKNNLIQSCVYLSCRRCIKHSWINHNEQFLSPSFNWINDYSFQMDCLVYTLFNEKNYIHNQSTNHWIPFTEKEVNARDNFRSHFMNDFITNMIQNGVTEPLIQDLFAFSNSQRTNGVPLSFSSEAQAVMDSGRELWKHYHKQENPDPNASYYDIRFYFQGTYTDKRGKEIMKNDSRDSRYMELISDLREKMKLLGKRIEPKVYEYGFLKRNYEQLPRPVENQYPNTDMFES